MPRQRRAYLWLAAVMALIVATVMVNRVVYGNSPGGVSAEPKEIYLAGGSFWGLEKYLGGLTGVLETEVGYANGEGEYPTYEQVSTGETGFVETVRVVYDPDTLPLDALLNLYFDAIDPVTLNQQGDDVGSQYRTGVYYISDADAAVVQSAMLALSKRVNGVLALESRPLECYYPAEAYHQAYYDQNQDES